MDPARAGKAYPVGTDEFQTSQVQSTSGEEGQGYRQVSIQHRREANSNHFREPVKSLGKVFDSCLTDPASQASLKRGFTSMVFCLGYFDFPIFLFSLNCL